MEKASYLVVGEQKIVSRYDQHGRLGAPSHDRERRQISGGQDQMQKIRRILSEAVDYLVDDSFASDMMVIIKHYDKRLLDNAEYLIDQKIRCPFRNPYDVFASLSEIRKNGVTKFWDLISNSVSYIGKKDGCIGIRMVELIPDRGTCLIAHKIRDQRGFTTTGVSRDHRQWISEICLQPLRKARPIEHLSYCPWRQKLCTEKEIRVLDHKYAPNPISWQLWHKCRFYSI